MNNTVALDSHAELLEDRPISPIEHDRVAAAAAAHDAVAACVPLLVLAGGTAAARDALGRALRVDRLAAGEDVLALTLAADGNPRAGVAAHLGLAEPADDAALAAALAVYAVAQTRLVILLHAAEHLGDAGLAELRRLRQADPAGGALSVVLLGDDLVARVADRLLRPSPPGGLRFIRLTPLAPAPAAPVATLPGVASLGSAPGPLGTGGAPPGPQHLPPAAQRPTWTPTPVASAPYGQDAPAWDMTFVATPPLRAAETDAAIPPDAPAVAAHPLPMAAAAESAAIEPAAAWPAEPQAGAPSSPAHGQGEHDLAWGADISPAAPSADAGPAPGAMDQDATDAAPWPDPWVPGYEDESPAEHWQSVHHDATGPDPAAPPVAWHDAAPGSADYADSWPASDDLPPGVPADDYAASEGGHASTAAPEAAHPPHADEYQDAFAQLAARDAAEAPRAPPMHLLRRSEVIPPLPVAAREDALADVSSHRPRILLPLAGIGVLAAIVGWFVVQALMGTAPPAPSGTRVATTAPSPAAMRATPDAAGAAPGPVVAAPPPPAAGAPAPGAAPPHAPSSDAAPAAASPPAAAPPPDAARPPDRTAAAAQPATAEHDAPAAAPPVPPAAPPVASQVTPTGAPTVAPVPVPSAGPGLLVIAKADDTLRSLYARVYKGLPAPPFETVAAMNPHDIKLGDVVVFPAPSGGWKRPPNTAGR